jgi:hypothetical protein
MNPQAPTLAPSEPLAALVYELLDAHDDTARLAAELALDRAAPGVPAGRLATLRWQAHLDYLRALQRKGRETLAHTCKEQP